MMTKIQSDTVRVMIKLVRAESIRSVAMLRKRMVEKGHELAVVNDAIRAWAAGK